MEEKPRNKSALYIVLVILGLLVSCGIGALLGGVAGYYAGQRSARAGIGRVFEEEMMPRLLTPVPRMTPRAGMPLLGRGALVTMVVDGSPADRAGLRIGDIVMAVDDQVLDQDSDLRDIIATYESGETVDLTVWREGDEIMVSVELGTNPDTSVTTPWLGVYYRTLNPVG